MNEESEEFLQQANDSLPPLEDISLLFSQIDKVLEGTGLAWQDIIKRRDNMDPALKNMLSLDFLRRYAKHLNNPMSLFMLFLEIGRLHPEYLDAIIRCHVDAVEGREDESSFEDIIQLLMEKAPFVSED